MDFFMIDMEDYGFTADLLPEKGGGLPARITAVHKERYTLVCKEGEVHGRLKPGVYYGAQKGRGPEPFPTVGDFVLLRYNPSGDSQITKTLARKSKFARGDFSGHAAGYVKTIVEQVVAANFDYVFIMQSLNQDLNLRRLERYLILALQSGAAPVVLLTKADLAPGHKARLQAVEAAVCRNSTEPPPIHAVSAITGYGLDTLAHYLKPRTTIAFLGSSGVGKSSLVNALAGENLMAVREIRAADDKGRHATTHRQLIMLKNGVMVIDTPGMRELGMWEVAEGLCETFADVEGYLGKCRFSDCKHGGEPGCAIQAAIADGTLSPARWDSYQKIKKEVAFVAGKSKKSPDKKGGNRNT